MASDLMTPANTAIPPAHPARIGSLPELIALLEIIKKDASEYANKIRTLVSQDVKSMFPNPRVLQDRTSHWYGFSTRILQMHEDWMRRTLYPLIDRDLTNAKFVLDRFIVYWHSSLGLAGIMTGEAQAQVRAMISAWTNIQISIRRPSINSPYRLELEKELHSCLGELKVIIDALPGYMSDAWSATALYRNNDTICDVWFTRDEEDLSHAMDISELSGAEEKGGVMDDSAALLYESSDSDLENGYGGHGPTCKVWCRRFRIEIGWILASITIGIIYAAVGRDVQTGLTLTGVLLAAGTILAAAVRYKQAEAHQKIALE